MFTQLFPDVPVAVYVTNYPSSIHLIKGAEERPLSEVAGKVKYNGGSQNFLDGDRFGLFPHDK
jgi:hypothetical protein